MANLWVVVTGLAVMVEKEGINKDPHRVLLLQVDSDTWVPDRRTGVRIQEHRPRLKLLSSSSSEIEIGNQDLDFLPIGDGSPVVSDSDPFLRVGRELTESLVVLSGFLGPRDASLNGWSRVNLWGGDDSVIWPIHVFDDFDITTIDTDPKLKLSGAHDLHSKSTKAKNKPRIGNGILYYRHIDSGQPQVSFSGGGSSPQWDSISKSDAQRLPVQNNERDFVAWVSNSGLGNDLGEEFDRDFYLLYNMLGDQVSRYVPVIQDVEKWVKNPPGQCMIGYALG
jgi:hypothetical protein